MEVIVKRVQKQSQMNQGRKRMGMTTASEAGRRRKVSSCLGRTWEVWLTEPLNDISLGAAGGS